MQWFFCFYTLRNMVFFETHITFMAGALFTYFVGINLIGFVLYGIDKRKAKKKVHRIPERILLNCSRLGGGAGAWLGMAIFRHKTLHRQFQILVPLWTFLWALFLIALVVKAKSIL